MREYERRVEEAPTREQELEILVRDYENLKANYRTLLDKKLNAGLAENLEKRQKGEQFRIVDPANLPGKPDKPDRMRIMMLGVLLGCGLGVGSAIGLELMRPVFRRSEDVESLLHLRVIASIPSFKSLLGGAQKNLYAKPITTAGRGNRLLANPMPAGESNSKDGFGGSLGETRTLDLIKEQRLGRAGMLRGLEVIGQWNSWSIVAEQNKGIQAKDAVRAQYLHAIALLPTVLDCLGITPPAVIRGVTQSPIEGLSFALTFDDTQKPSRRTTHYFEMMGHRSIYHDGWRAVCPWPGPSFAEAGKFFGAPITAEELTKLEASGWELYHVAEDFAENHNVAAQNRS